MLSIALRRMGWPDDVADLISDRATSIPGAVLKVEGDLAIQLAPAPGRPTPPTVELLRINLCIDIFSHVPHQRELSDIASLKALAHPLRQRMLTRLQRRGPATSADLAVEFGVDRGATSYHLRQLARFGFIEEDEARSTGRLKFWRAAPQDIRLPRHSASADTETAAGEVLRQWQQRSERDLAAFLADPESFGDVGAAALQSFGSTLLTADELTHFTEEYIALLDRWSRDPEQATPGSQHITVLFHAFPTPDERNRS
ncbi:hypothetical protein GCM10012280_68380 [Wenjunlia tyrosinilytica]|uniref:HTH arsR-type domain-containing protein n=1 Tax=Wenjunlia tyrosinilytica TaxID=1544741 RepID=A0A917ZY83_9ACTN|nr:hypothetical protein GCM10012280_68380 [Wenjunlia tyrosinilytica]